MQSVVSLSKVAEVYAAHQDFIQEGIREFRAIEMILTRTRKTVLFTLGCRFLGRDFTCRFFTEFEDGIGKSGACVFRKLMVANSNKVRGKLHTVEVFALGIKAMIADYLGQDVKILKWVSSESFPRFEDALIRAARVR